MNESQLWEIMFWKPGTAWCSDFTALYTLHESQRSLENTHEIQPHNHRCICFEPINCAAPRTRWPRYLDLISLKHNFGSFLFETSPPQILSKNSQECRNRLNQSSGRSKTAWLRTKKYRADLHAITSAVEEWRKSTVWNVLELLRAHVFPLFELQRLFGWSLK